MGGWAEDLSSPLIVDYRSYSVACPVGLSHMAACFINRVSASKMEVTDFCNGITGVTSHHLSYFVGSVHIQAEKSVNVRGRDP